MSSRVRTCIRICIPLAFPLATWAQSPSQSQARAALAAPVSASVPASVPASAPASIDVSTFEVKGNTLLPADRIDAALEPYKGQRTLKELGQAALAVQALYRRAGYGAVLAYLPAQTGSPGTVVIQVLEGHVSQVKVSGNKIASDAQVRRSIPALREGETPRVSAIDAQIELANENPARQESVSLAPGAAAGEVEARVLVTELAQQQWTVGVDNTGVSSTGRWRASVGYQRSNLWGLDHVVSLQYQTAPEHVDHVTVGSVGYRAPLYGAGLMLDAYAAYSDVDAGTTQTSAGALAFGGKGKVFGWRLSGLLPRHGDLTQQLSAGVDWRTYLNHCAIAGLPDGACGSAGASVAVLPFTVDYSLRNSGPTPWALQLTAEQNIDAGGRHASRADFQAVRTGAKPGFFSARLNASGALPLPADWQLQGRVIGQASGDALVSAEQFGLGGAMTVRGYEEREISGDQGLLGRFELFGPDLGQWLGGSDDAGKRQWRLLGFVDAGRVWNHLGTPCRGDDQTRCTLASTGLGSRLQWGALAVRLDLAHALKPGSQTSRGDTFLHVQAQYSFE